MEARGHAGVARPGSRISICGVVACLAMPCVAQQAIQPLSDLTLEQLSQLEVTSVSKSTEIISSAPAAIFVLTREDLLRAGITSIAEALRLAPNLQITQYSASNHIAGARGFAGAQEAQNFSNKLLVLIDGRSVYTPLYSGVFLDVQDVLMDDIDRIEVISGPGATLWGANAMNGVINIITRPAYLTDQSLLSAGYGNLQRSVSARYGSRPSGALAYRVYGRAFEREAMELADGASAEDDWDKAQAGFRVDWTGAVDTITTQGDLYRGHQSQIALDDQRVEGANLLSRWTHRAGASEWQLQAYYDYTERAQPDNGVGFTLRTFDLELQQRFASGIHRVVWGGGLRVHRYDINNSATLLFEPHEHTLKLGNLFAQDTLALTSNINLTLGLKLERDGYSKTSPLPDIRLTWRIADSTLLWASAARAIRSPTPFDRDVIEVLDGTVFLTGNKSFDPEKVDAFELGVRVQPLSTLSLSASTFYNVYDDLRSIEPQSDTEFLPLKWDNLLKGKTYGLEAWAKWQVADWWRLSPGVRLLQKDLEFKRGASQLLDESQVGNDVRHQGLLTSSMDFGRRVSLDATLRRVGALPAPRLEAYTELRASLNYRPHRHLDLSLSGINLLDDSHLEYPAPSGVYIRRGVLAQARWTFAPR